MIYLSPGDQLLGENDHTIQESFLHGETLVWITLPAVCLSLFKCMSANLCWPCQRLKKQVYTVEILLTAISLSQALHLTGNGSFSKL